MTVPSSGRQDQIIEVARRLFARHGYRGTSLSMIAAEVNVSKAALYHHFPNKDELYRRVIVTGMENLFVFVDKRVQIVGDDPKERLCAFMHASVAYYEQYRDSWLAGSLLFWTSESEEHRAIVLKWRDAYEGLLKDAIRDGMAAGLFRPETDVSLASKFMLSSLNQLPRWYRPDGEKSAAQIMDNFLGMFFQGVEAPSVESLRPSRQPGAGKTKSRAVAATPAN